jgi:muconolactone delta-isomerase
MLMTGMGAWLQKYGGRFSTIEFFVAGGGFGVIDIDDSSELHRIIAEHPFTGFSDVEVRPVVDPATAMSNLQAAFAERGIIGE